MIKFLLVKKLIDLMQESLKSSKIKRSVEDNWMIREIFSESALSNFLRELDDQVVSIEKKE